YQIFNTNVNTTNVSCFEASNGSITISNIQGDLPPYLFYLDGNQNASVDSFFNNIIAGTHTVRIVGSEGSEIIIEDIVISQPLAPLTITANTDENLVELVANGGVAPYSFSIDGVTYQETNQFDNLLDGIYQGYVKDANNCISNIEFSIIGTSTSDNGFSQHVYIYPNPVSQRFYIYAALSSIPKYYIYNTKGQLMQNGTSFSKHPILISDLKPGIYLVKIKISNKIECLKLVVI
ncbi:MAG: T9SS type A sorting domain-containing protein, partial [Saprospiraceae bacterium]